MSNLGIQTMPAEDTPNEECALEAFELDRSKLLDEDGNEQFAAVSEAGHVIFKAGSEAEVDRYMEANRPEQNFILFAPEPSR